MAWLEVLGIVLEGVGIVVALYGLRARFREFAPAGQSEFDPLKDAIRGPVQRLGGTLRARWNRLRGRPTVVEVRAVAAMGASGTLKARARIGWGPLPSGRSNKPALAELDRRTRYVLDRVTDVDEKVDDEKDRVDAELGRGRDDLRAEAARLQEQVRRLATGDVTLQYVGLGLVAIGLFMQAGVAVAVAIAR